MRSRYFIEDKTWVVGRLSGAFVENQVTQLTGNRLTFELVGRATYFKFMQLWVKDSGNLTYFTTHFSFAIDSQNRSVYGDGIAFFLAPVGSKIPLLTKGGSTMGLSRDDQALDSVDNPFVAVEFDIYSNDYLDPPREHVGIDLNSLKSVANISWYSNIAIKEGKRNEAWISYNSSSHNLSVFFTGFRNNVPIRQFLSTNVDLSHFLPELVTFGFSASTGNSSAIHTIYSWDFSSSLEIDDNITITKDPVSSPNIPAPNQRKDNALGLAVGLGSGGFVLVGGLALVLFALWKKSRRNKEEDYVLDDYIDEEFERARGPRKFTYNELVHATNDFDDKEKLGQGGFGAVYKGLLRDSNTFVAVKRVAKGSKQGLNEYKSEVKIIMRYKIAQGLASSLLYLHEEWEQCVLQRDVKSSNIMLDSNFNAKLGDFGLARLVDHVKGSQTTNLAGTMGYMAPEYITTCKATKESDVYSFGIVALEIAYGRKAINHMAIEEEVVMVEWVRELYRILAILEGKKGTIYGGDRF
uniref:Protein kinase domain-containing protein n=1 Tax=Quercus lobata TaxID=97700 RepID=A0A7N2LU68_QUELO